MRTFTMPQGVSPREAGRAHGEMFRGEIQSLAEIRTYLCQHVGGIVSRDRVIELAEKHLPVLAEFDADLHEELLGIAEGAAVSPAAIIILNHYTDLRDLGHNDSEADSGGCSVLYARTPEGPVLAQTWDMHATAIPYVMMLRVPGPGDSDAWILSLTGCLGMAGMTRGGLAIAINNLHSTDAQVGVVWPALVRKALAAGDVEAARDIILKAPLGSGHHYLVADQSAAYGIETSGLLRELVYDGKEDTFVHTNHCLLERVSARSRVPGTSSTRDRYRSLWKDVAERPVADARDAFDRLGSHDGYPRSVCQNMSTPENPHGPATCGGVAMDLTRGVLLAVAGLTHNVAPERYDFSDEGSA